MSDQFNKSNRMTFADSDSATSSAAFLDGPTPCALLDGLTTDLFGQEVVHAPRLAPQAKTLDAHNATRRALSLTLSELARLIASDATTNGKPTKGTYGLSFSVSSESADLSEFSANRLRRQMDGLGSMLFSLRWKWLVTPLGRRICQLAASQPRTSGSDCGSWPTPNAGPQNHADTTWQKRREELKAKHGNGNGFGMVLGQAAQLVSWPTPREMHSNESAHLDSWITLQAKDYRSGQEKRYLEKVHALSLNDQVTLTPGPTSSGSPAQTESKGQQAWSTPRANKWGFPDAHGSHEKPTGKGQLNPLFSLWLMGLPSEWIAAAPLRGNRGSRCSGQ